MRVTDEMVRRLSDHLKQKVFYGTLNNEARDTKAREFLEVALSHAAGQEGVASSFVCTGDQIRCFDGNGCECELNGLLQKAPAQPPASAGVGRDAERTTAKKPEVVVGVTSLDEALQARNDAEFALEAMTDAYNAVCDELDALKRKPEGRAVVDLGEGGILHGASISGNVTIKAARIGQASACTFTGTTPAAEQGEGA